MKAEYLRKRLSNTWAPSFHKAEALSALFTSVFNCEISLRNPKLFSQRPRRKAGARKTLVKEDEVREYISERDLHKSMGPGEVFSISSVN